MSRSLTATSVMTVNPAGARFRVHAADGVRDLRARTSGLGFLRPHGLSEGRNYQVGNSGTCLKISRHARLWILSVDNSVGWDQHLYRSEASLVYDNVPCYPQRMKYSYTRVAGRNCICAIDRARSFVARALKIRDNPPVPPDRDCNLYG